MRLARVLGAAFFVLGLLILGYELTLWRESGAWPRYPIGQIWFDLSAPSLNATQAVIQRYLHPALWENGIAVVLRWNAAYTALAVGAALYAFSHLKKRRPRSP